MPSSGPSCLVASVVALASLAPWCRCSLWASACSSLLMLALLSPALALSGLPPVFTKFKRLASRTIRSNGVDCVFVLALVVFVCLVLGGCASVDPFAHDSVARSQDFNAWWGSK